MILPYSSLSVFKDRKNASADGEGENLAMLPRI
jgi:hypothetical protein